MSKESYIRGFCKAAEAAGVDPVALAKYAEGGNAGIGSVADNFGAKELVSSGKEGRSFRYGEPHRGSYIKALQRATAPIKHLSPSRDAFEYAVSPDSPKDVGDSHIITQAELNSLRGDMAKHWAGKLFPKGSDPYQRLVENLINAGARNQEYYKTTGQVPRRTEPDRYRIEGLEIPDYIRESDLDAQNQLHKDGIRTMDDWLSTLQNSMVRNGHVRHSNLA